MKSIAYLCLKEYTLFVKYRNKLYGGIAMNRIYEFLKECGTYFIATVEGDKPHVRPFGTIDLYEGRLYIQTGKVKSVSKQIKVNPNIEICGMKGDKWIRVEAKAVLDERIEPQVHMLEQYPSLQGRYKAGDGNNEVFCLKEGTAQICSFTEDPEIINF